MFLSNYFYDFPPSIAWVYGSVFYIFIYQNFSPVKSFLCNILFDLSINVWVRCCNLERQAPFFPVSVNCFVIMPTINARGYNKQYHAQCVQT